MGYGRGEGTGLLGMLVAAIRAIASAGARVQQVYDRNCPGHCDDGKSGLAAIRIIGFSITRVPVNPAPGARQRLGWVARVKWRLWVNCSGGEAGRVDADASWTGWDELEALFGEHYHEPNLG